ncbi:hypothetical protein M408DRAFT_325870 [Serendipita vermifera MAFF 305830]|uniref:RNA helicase n=1 Tax=Serendipita vermifera MAFF 305830 TaxID=933852 RepID=A0A0C3BQV2_SERVB|nr:hypothetical protein M408DRAFT_325870 [Serendipita vermifera MAFF 305830]
MLRARNSSFVPKKCTLCDAVLPNENAMTAHLRGQRHLVRLLALRAQGNAALDERTIFVDDDNSFECLICEKQIWNQTKAGHEATLQHKRKEGFIPIQAALEEAGRDKYGVTVIPAGKEAFNLGLNEAGRVSFEFSLKVDHTESSLILRSANLSTTTTRSRSGFTLDISAPSTLSVNPVKGKLIFGSQGNRGRFQDRIELIFYDTVSRRQFAIVKSTSIIIGNKGDYEALKPIAPYVPKTFSRKDPVKEEDITDGERPAPIATIKWVKKLLSYDISEAFSWILNMPSMPDKLRLLKSGFVPRELSPQTHAKVFHALLHIEEYQSKIDIERYAQEDVTLEADRRGLYYLIVPGLAEKRPSLIVGDQILVQHHRSARSNWWRGYVHEVQLDRVGLRFHVNFKPLKGQKFDVRFELNRLTLRRMHQGLDVGGQSPRILFPQDAHVQNHKPLDSTIRSLNPFNRYIGQNDPQMIAVAAIRDLPPGSPPFVVFGPPGTGKTVTIIEAMRQILQANPKARILACAPSNAAADIIAERLLVLTKSQLFRLNAPSRSASHLPTALQEVSRKNSQGTFEVPPVTELAKFRVVVSTCLSSSVLYGIGLPTGHFSHIFIDEAGQACEPEALIAIRTMANSHTNLILSGDPKQLGPVIRSSMALKLGLGNSLLDRLTATDLYDDRENRGVTIVKLIQNFRSHPAILRFPNETFYRGELETKADPVTISSMLRASCLKRPGFPVVFHAIAGKDTREASSPSFFNVDEASLVKKYIQDLKADQRLRLTNEQIGVISPYHAQCGKIRKIISPFAKGVKVGSVEEFQGQERRVIIVSTVRSNLEWVDSDIKHSLGFVATPRRFNVAMTRAQALLIVIGDPNVLSLDPLWRSFLNYIYNSGGWTGRPLPCWDTTDPSIDNLDLLEAQRAVLSEEDQKLIARITETIDGVVSTENMEDRGDGYEAVERPWREAD